MTTFEQTVIDFVFLQKVLDCSSEILSPLWNGNTRHVYLSNLAGRIIDAGRNQEKSTVLSYLKGAYRYAESNEKEIMLKYFPYLN